MCMRCLEPHNWRSVRIVPGGAEHMFFSLLVHATRMAMGFGMGLEMGMGMERTEETTLETAGRRKRDKEHEDQKRRRGEETSSSETGRSRVLGLRRWCVQLIDGRKAIFIAILIAIFIAIFIANESVTATLITTSRLELCIPVSLYSCTPVLLCSCIPVFLASCTIVRLFDSTS